jgi:hypothetical protein
MKMPRGGIKPSLVSLISCSTLQPLLPQLTPLRERTGVVENFHLMQAGLRERRVRFGLFQLISNAWSFGKKGPGQASRSPV